MPLYRKLKPLFAALGRLRIPVYAGNASFFLLLSCFPLAILVLAIIPLTPLTKQDLLLVASQALPEQILPFFSYLTDDLYAEGSAALISVNVVAALWSASKGMLSILYGLNRVAGVTETRNYFVRRGLCILYTLATLVALLLTLLLLVFGQSILQFLTSRGFSLAYVFSLLLEHLHLYSMGLLTLFFCALFLALPCRRGKLRQVWPGAMAAAAAWILFSWLFSYYVEHFGNYAALYGNLTTVILTMLWLYFCLSILFYGAWLNRLIFTKNPLDS